MVADKEADKSDTAVFDEESTDKKAEQDIQADKVVVDQQAIPDTQVDKEKIEKQDEPDRQMDKQGSVQQATPDIQVGKENIDKQDVADVRMDTADVGKQVMPEVEKEVIEKEVVQDIKVDNDVTDKQTVQDVEVDKEKKDKQTVPDVEVDKENIDKQAVPDIKIDKEVTDKQALPGIQVDNAIRSENLEVGESTRSEIQAEASEIVIDGTAFPAEYFGGVDVTSSVAQEPVKSSILESASIYIANSAATTSIQPTQARTGPSEKITQQTFESQAQATKDLSEETPVQKSEELPIQETKELTKEQTFQEKESKGLDVTSSDSYSVMSTATEAVKSDYKIEPSETVIERSAAPSRQADSEDTSVVPINQVTDSKPLVIQATVLKPSSSVFSSIDLKKYETPYQASTKVLPLNQGVDVNNRFTPAVVQSSIETSATAMHTDNESAAAHGVEIPRAEVKANVTVQSDSVQEKVQPSLSQDPYKTVDFVARKTLSAENESVRKEVDGQPDVQRQEPQIPKPQEIKQDQDQVKHTVDDPHRQLPDLPVDHENQQEHATKEMEVPVHTTPASDKMDLPVPPTLRPKVDENNNLGGSGFGSDPSLTQKLPDEKQDVTPELSLVQKMEPQLKLLVDKVCTISKHLLFKCSLL